MSMNDEIEDILTTSMTVSTSIYTQNIAKSREWNCISCMYLME